MKPGNVKCEGDELADCLNFSSFLLSFVTLHSHKVSIAVKGESKDNHLLEKHRKNAVLVQTGTIFPIRRSGMTIPLLGNLSPESLDCFEP